MNDYKLGTLQRLFEISYCSAYIIGNNQYPELLRKLL